MEVRLEQKQKPPLRDRWEDIQGAHSWKGLLEPLDPVLKSEILRYGDFTRVCYTARNNHQILAEKLLFEESENLQKCGYNIKEYIYTNVRSSTSYFGKKSVTTSWIGFIAVCTDGDEIKRLGRRDIVVAFRGTSELREWIQNLKRNPPGANSVGDVKIYKGFLGYYEDKGKSESDNCPRDIIERCITGLLEEYEGQSLSITVTGHSMGGALAIVSAYHIKKLRPLIPVTVFTFASPRVGNEAFVNDINAIEVKVLRVVVKGDLVPKVPKLVGYCHVGIKFRLHPSSSHDLRRRDKFFRRHSLNVYLHLIDGYQGNNQDFESSARGRNYIANL